MFLMFYPIFFVIHLLLIPQIQYVDFQDPDMTETYAAQLLKQGGRTGVELTSSTALL